MEVALHRFLRALLWELRLPPQSYPIWLVDLKENEMGLWTANVALGPGSAPDSITQHVKLIVDGVEKEEKVRVIATESPVVSFTGIPEGAQVRIECRDGDDAVPPNLSAEPQFIEFVPKDTTPPPTSSAMSVELAEEPPA